MVALGGRAVWFGIWLFACGEPTLEEDHGAGHASGVFAELGSRAACTCEITENVASFGCGTEAHGGERFFLEFYVPPEPWIRTPAPVGWRWDGTSYVRRADGGQGLVMSGVRETRTDSFGTALDGVRVWLDVAHMPEATACQSASVCVTEPESDLVDGYAWCQVIR